MEICNSFEGERCSQGVCRSPCELAEESRSYLGCEYWPTVTANVQLGALGGTFDFAVAVGNPQTVPVDIVVERDGQPVETTTVEAGGGATIALPWVPELRQSAPSGDPFNAPTSVLAKGGAYRLSSTLPVSAYQFNPLQHVSTTGAGYSHTNDASLLFPTSALGQRYIVVARPSLSVVQSQPMGGEVLQSRTEMPGFFAVVGTADGTSVRVQSSMSTVGGTGSLSPPLGPGEERTFTLDRGDVLQIFSAPSPDSAECRDIKVSPPFTSGQACIGDRGHDPTGTIVEADAPVAVLGGHACSFVPFDRWACDHLEEQLPPVDAWGRTVAAVSTAPQAPGEPNVWRIVSGSPDNSLTFDPPQAAAITLNEGELVEIEVEGALSVEATGRILVAQFMVGKDYRGAGAGDPAMGIAVPTEQFRTDYDFLVPDTYVTNHVGILAPMGTAPMLDGNPISELSAVGSTGLGFARIEVAAGPHHMEGIEGFGITVSGVAPYTSYLYPGGLDLAPLPFQ